MAGVGCRCVSLDGDDFNPGGTVTGGRRRDPGRVLEACFAAAAAEFAAGQAQQAVAAAKQHLADLTPAAQQHSKYAQICTLNNNTQHVARVGMGGASSFSSLDVFDLRDLVDVALHMSTNLGGFIVWSNR